MKLPPETPDMAFIVNETGFLSLDGCLRFFQLLKHTIRKSRGPCSSAGKTEHQEKIYLIVFFPEILTSIAVVRVIFLQGDIDWIVGNNPQPPGQERSGS